MVVRGGYGKAVSHPVSYIGELVPRIPARIDTQPPNRTSEAFFAHPHRHTPSPGRYAPRSIIASLSLFVVALCPCVRPLSVFHVECRKREMRRPSLPLERKDGERIGNLPSGILVFHVILRCYMRETLVF